MSNTYRDRLAGETFESDIECEVRLQPDPRDESVVGANTWISERLLARLRHLGLAYDLHLLARLPSNGQVAYPDTQLPLLEDALAFLFDVIADPALLKATLPIRDLIGQAKRDPRGWSLIVTTE